MMYFFKLMFILLLGSITSPAAEEVSLKLLLRTTVTYISIILSISLYDTMW